MAAVWESGLDVHFNPSKLQVTGSKQNFDQNAFSMVRFWKLSPVPDILGLIFQVSRGTAKWSL